MLLSGNRRSRSRSPTRVENVGRRRENRDNMTNVGNMNQIMMNNMYQQGGMMIASSMYPNMMMPSHMMTSGIMPTQAMEMIPGTSMDILSQPPMDMTIAAQTLPTGSGIEMNMMGGMIMDPSMMGMSMYTNMGIIPEKKEIILKTCTLTPPTSESQHNVNPRSRPPGCRTIFIGGLPERIRESTVKEIFERYGSIYKLRLSKKNFCHIRYEQESSVDAAIALSGYRLKLTEKNKDNEDEEESQANSSWLHVDFALSRDDQNEYERKQRQAFRVQQAELEHMSIQQDMSSERSSIISRRRSPSPPRIQPYSNAISLQINEKIKSEEHFASTLPILISWLERGECSKKNSSQFYSMIQATNTHIRRIFNEKMQYDEELLECKERVKNNIAKLIEQLEQVGAVFNAAMHQRVWDHFTKPQRKNIETWQKMALEFHSLKEEFREKFECDDNDGNGFSKCSESSEDFMILKKENDSLQFQLEAYKNEVDVIKDNAQKEMEKFKAQYIARQALLGVMDNNPPLPVPVEKPPPPPPLPEDLNTKINLKNFVEAGCGEAKLIGVMSAFLQVHPKGASLDYVVSYVRALFPHVSQATVHHVLQKHTDVFKQNTSGVGANIENRWSFVAFHQ